MEERLILRRRQVLPEDEAFLFALYASTRDEELAILAWSEEQLRVFLLMQFHAQQDCYQGAFSDANFDLLLANDQPIGRLYVHRQADELSILDIALLPVWRNRGLGTQIIREIQAEAHAGQVPVTLHVAVGNPARRLYERLGFRMVKSDGQHLRLRWQPRYNCLSDSVATRGAQDV
jgi:RimJ/RimL family protein N-acetyltransferase